MKKFLEIIVSKRKFKCIDTRNGESFRPVECREATVSKVVENFSAHRFY